MRLLPVAVMIVGILVGLYLTGEGDTISEIVGSANSYRALMWASLAGCTDRHPHDCGAAASDSLDEIVDAWVSGCALHLCCDDYSGARVVDVRDQPRTPHGRLFDRQPRRQPIPASALPAVIFVLAAFTAFSTGSSWGAMGILLPLVLPLCWAIMGMSGSHRG